IIVAVNGLAHGGGCEITEAAPLAIASDRAEFCKAEINLGFAPPFGGSQRLPRLIGRKRALRMILTAEPITAEAACRLGLVNEVVPQARLLDTAFALAHTIAEKSPLAVTACLGSVTRGLNVPIDEGLAIEANDFARIAATRDIQEGISAWLEERRPNFIGRLLRLARLRTPAARHRPEGPAIAARDTRKPCISPGMSLVGDATESHTAQSTVVPAVFGRPAIPSECQCERAERVTPLGSKRCDTNWRGA